MDLPDAKNNAGLKGNGCNKDTEENLKLAGEEKTNKSRGQRSIEYVAHSDSGMWGRFEGCGRLASVNKEGARTSIP